MAMLAGPRQRKRYNLVPKGKALFEDGDRFGTKMLEKMGWTKGKGLGSKENGQQEFIRIRYKNDPNGLGYEERDDQWTEHEKHFNGLLESLHAGDSNSNTASGDDGDDSAPRVGFGFEKSKTNKDKLKDKFSGQSLEERSKKSKARVHYKKFTKGKDMAQYSEKDLANIFGKKATAEENDFYSQLPSFNAGNEANDVGAKQPTFELGTHTINTGLSVSDYFKMKMDALKNKKKEEKEKNGDGQENEESQLEVIDVTNETDDESNQSSRKKKKKSNEQKLKESEKENGFEATSEEINLNGQQAEKVIEKVGEESILVKSKKKKSKKTSQCEKESICDEVIIVEDEESEEQPPKKKKKKKSAEDSAPDLVTEAVMQLDLTTQTVEADASVIPLKKKKSKKSVTEDKVEPEEEPQQVLAESVAEEQSQKKKKNKKRKAEEATESLANDQSDIPLKKKKTKGSPEDESDNSSPQPEPTENLEKKKTKKQQTIVETPTDSTVLTENNSTKSKKKNKSKSTSTTTTDNPVKVSSQHEISRLTDCNLDTYKISTFCAEKFRNVDLASFHCSNISQLIGYGFSENLELQIVSIDGDRDRITKLWSGTSNKYQHAVPKREIYRNYMMKAKQARREKKKIPKMKVKPLHRLSAFQSL